MFSFVDVISYSYTTKLKRRLDLRIATHASILGKMLTFFYIYIYFFFMRQNVNVVSNRTKPTYHYYLYNKKKNDTSLPTILTCDFVPFCFCIFIFGVFFFFLARICWYFKDKIHCLWIVYALFTHNVRTVHVFKNIINRSHGIIYTFKNYFATVFLVFSFSNNKFNPNGSFSVWFRMITKWRERNWERKEWEREFQNLLKMSYLRGVWFINFYNSYLCFHNS